MECRPFYQVGFGKNDDEKVRDWFIEELTKTYGYLLADIEIEYKVTMGTGTRYADIVVYHKINGKREPYIVVEIKNRGIKEGKEQLLSYMSAIASAKYGVYTNGQQLKVYEKWAVDGMFDLKDSKDLPTCTEAEEKQIVELPFSKQRKIPMIQVDLYDRSKPGYMVPVYHYTAAGMPIDTQERYFGQIFVPEEFAKNKNITAAYVKGDSMQDIGIKDGNVVLIKEKSYPVSGEIGVCVLPMELGGGAACKKIRFENGQWRLISMNDGKNYKDLIVKEVQYIGEVVAIYEEVR